MKKVLIFSLQYYPLVGGAEVALKEITDRVEDIEFHMVTLRFDADAPKEERIGNVFVHRVGWGRRGLTYAQSFSPAVYLSKVFFVPLAALAARRLHQVHRFDGFWAMMSYMLFPIVLLRWSGIRVPYLLTLQEGDPFERVFNRPHILLFRPLLKYGFVHASAVQAISSFLSKWAKLAGYPGTPEIIPNGYINESRHNNPVWFSVNPGEQERRVFWKNQGGFNVTKTNKILITASRLVHKNAIDDVISALPRLPKEVIFVILGDGNEKEKLEEQAARLGVSDRVFFCGQVKNTAVLYYLHASDIFIRPSRSEGMGNSFIEAMAAGLPVIGTQEGGIADFLYDAERNPGKVPTGFAVDRDAPEQIAKRVAYILEHPGEVAKTVENAKKLAKERYDWDHIASQMHALLLRVCG